MPWQIWRQDDNGNRFPVATYAGRDLAEKRMAELTKVQHKQTYWMIEITDNRETGVTGSHT